MWVSCCRCLCLSLVLLPLWVQAIDVHTCRDEGGTTVYQQIPCGDGQEPVSHRQFEVAPATAEAPASASASAERRVSRTPQRSAASRSTDRSGSGAGARDPVVAYECRSAGQRWIQTQPCATRALDLKSASGLRAPGARIEAAVKETRLTRRQVCDQVRDGSYRAAPGERASDSAYQRNLMRDRC